MPEFEEKDSQPNPEHNYIPSADTSPKNKGGRRRSGGFKSEAVPSNSKIGEIDPAEALKAEVKKSTSLSPKVTETENSDLSQFSNTAKESCSLKTKKSKSSNPQPEKATLDSIKKVEEKIAQRRAESDKDRSERNERKPKNFSSHTQKRVKKAVNGGILAAISRFFGSFFGGNSKDSSTKGPARSSQRSRPQRRNPRRGNNGTRNNDSGKRHKNRRGDQRHQRKNASQNT